MLKNFNKQPAVDVPGREGDCYAGWGAIGREILRSIENSQSAGSVIVVETYQGVHYEALLDDLVRAIKPGLVVDTRDLFLPESAIRALTWPDVTDDRIFGYMSRLSMSDFLDQERLEDYSSVIGRHAKGIILLYGFGASLVPVKRDLLVNGCERC